MDNGDQVSCILCQRSEETKTTGALSTNDEVTAHQNCLLFSSGIYCRDTPQFDDLFGFSVDDVLDEVKRGKLLICTKCKKKGATAGCEVGRCKKSYHYPCAVEERAKTIEDEVKGKYVLYCLKHYEVMKSKESGSVNGCASSVTKSKTTKNPSEAGSSKEVHCPACRKTEGNISLESLSDRIIMSYCKKHAPQSHKGDTNGHSSSAGPTVVYSSDSSNSTNCSFSKRLRTLSDKPDETPSKRKSNGRKKNILSSSSSDDNEPNSEMAMFGPLEFDLEESLNCVPESPLIRKDSENPGRSPKGNPLEDVSRDETKDDEETFISDAESESLLRPVHICMESESLASLSTITMTSSCMTLVDEVEVETIEDEAPSPQQSPDLQAAGLCAPQQTSTGPPHSPDQSQPCRMTGSPLCARTTSPSALPQTLCIPLIPTSTALVSDPALSIDSASFWEGCNAAGCTQAIFTDFILEMNQLSSRIQSSCASQEDYDRALTVMATSGKLAELVAKQHKELQRKQMELQKAAAAMDEVVSALKR